jgi:hypothetical protein
MSSHLDRIRDLTPVFFEIILSAVLAIAGVALLLYGILVIGFGSVVGLRWIMDKSSGKKLSRKGQKEQR